MNKSKIRKKILKLRELKYNDNLKINFKKILSIIKKKKKKLVVGGYYPVNYEIDDIEILKELNKKNCITALPKISEDNQMNFYSWDSHDVLKINKYGIPEPIKGKSLFPDVLLVPLVAFDKQNFRIGYGGGYYDRYISRILKKKKCITIGLGFSFQKIKKIDNEMYDKKLDYILTEKN